MNQTIQSEDQLTLAFLTKYPIEGARVLESLTPETTATLLASFPPQFIARTFQYLLPHRRLSIFQFMSEESTLEILTKMTPSFAFITLHFANPTWRAGLLAKMDFRQSASVLKAFSLKEGSAGRFANPHVLTFTGDRTVSDVIQWVQTQQDHGTHEIYVVDRHHKYLGCVSMQGLLIADLDDLLHKVVSSSQQVLSANWSLEKIFNSSLWLTNHTLPVIDTNKTFLGVISYSSLLSIQKSKQQAHMEETEPSCELNVPHTSPRNGKTLPHFITPATSRYAIDPRPQQIKTKPPA